jgi:phosphate-selective porin OprO/OprP
VGESSLFVEGEIYERFIFKAQYDFARGDAEIKDVFLGIKDIGPVGNVLLGHIKEPYSLAELTSTKYLSFPERSLPVLAFAPSRNFGIMFYDAPMQERMRWAAGAFRETDPFGRTFGGDLNYTGRLTGLPVYRAGGRRLLHVGAAYSYLGVPGGTYRIRCRPEIPILDLLCDTEGIPAESAVQLGLELALVQGPFYLQTEWFQSEVESSETGKPVFDGYYVEASYFLTGENKVYQRSRASFDRLRPKRPIRRDWASGAWEIAARYGTLDLNDAEVDGGVADTVSVSLNWYLNSFVRMLFTWSGTEDEEGTLLYPFLIPFQTDFYPGASYTRQGERRLRVLSAPARNLRSFSAAVVSSLFRARRCRGKRSVSSEVAVACSRVQPWLLVTMLALASLPGSIVLADDDGKDPLFDRFSLVVANYYAGVDTEIRLFSEEAGTEVVLDFEDDLDLDSADRRFWVDMAFQLGRRHEIGFSYFDWSRDSTTVFLEEIEIDGEILPIEVEVFTVFDAKIAEFSYTYWAIRKQRAALGISGGLVALSLKTAIREAELELDVETETDLPVPMIGVAFRYAIAPKLILRAEARLIDVEIDKYSGFAASTLAELEHLTLRHLGFGLGLNGTLFDLNVDTGTILGSYVQEYLGVQVFARVRY